MQKKFQKFPNFLVKNWQNFARDNFHFQGKNMKEIMGLKRNFIIFNSYFPIPTIIFVTYNAFIPFCTYNIFIPSCHLQYIHLFLPSTMFSSLLAPTIYSSLFVTTIYLSFFAPTIYSSLSVTYNIFIPFCPPMSQLARWPIN